LSENPVTIGTVSSLQLPAPYNGTDQTTDGARGDLHWFMLPVKALVLAWMPGAGVGCTSCKGLPRPNALASKDVFGACPGPGVTSIAVLSNAEGGPIEPAACSPELRRMSDWDSDSSATVLVPSTLLAFFELDGESRGSSWHRCPMFRLMHL